MERCTVKTLTATITGIGGLRRGKHTTPEDGCCFLEAIALCEGRPHTDDPDVLDLFDVRPLNDASWSSEAKLTEQLLRIAPLVVAWRDWTADQRAGYAERLAMLIVRGPIADLTYSIGLSAAADTCRRARTPIEAYAAANDARYASAERGACSNVRASARAASAVSAVCGLVEPNFAIKNASIAASAAATDVIADQNDTILTSFVECLLNAMPEEARNEH